MVIPLPTLLCIVLALTERSLSELKPMRAVEVS